MENRILIMNLLEERKQYMHELDSLVYGSVEIREKGASKYIYVHYREDGIALTKYVGEFSEELYNLVISNTLKAKELKKKIKEVSKQLDKLDYTDEKLDDKVALNIDFARRHMVDTIYKQAVLEGVATTYSDTETIIEGGKVNNMTADDVLKVLNLKHAWEFTLNKYVVMSPTNFGLLCEINKLVEEGFYYNAGKVRSTPVSIGGTTWKPEMPVENVVMEEVEQIIKDKTKTSIDIAIELLLYVMKKQVFIDGNKRTAVIFANHYLISHGAGLMVIPNERVDEYKKLLIAYYEGRDTNSIKTFLKNECFMRI